MKPVDIEELKSLLEEVKNSRLDQESHAKLRAAVESYRYLAELVCEEGTTAERVRERFSERYRIVRNGDAPSDDDTESTPDATEPR